MAKCRPCLGSAIKEAIQEADLGSAVDALLEKIPDCDQEKAIELCGKAKRQATPRNLFMGTCMRAGSGMKECSEKWKMQSQ